MTENFLTSRRERHVVDDGKVMEAGGRDSSLDLPFDGILLRVVAPSSHQPDHLLSGGKEGFTNGTIHSMDQTVISVLILTVLTEDLA